MPLDDVAEFWRLFDEARGELSIRHIEKRAEAPRGRIGNAYSNKREPSRLVIESIADGLRLNRRIVLGWATVLPAINADNRDEEELLYWYGTLTDDEKQYIRTTVRALAQERGSSD